MYKATISFNYKGRRVRWRLRHNVPLIAGAAHTYLACTNKPCLNAFIEYVCSKDTSFSVTVCK